MDSSRVWTRLIVCFFCGLVLAAGLAVGEVGKASGPTILWSSGADSLAPIPASMSFSPVRLSGKEVSSLVKSTGAKKVKVFSCRGGTVGDVRAAFSTKDHDSVFPLLRDALDKSRSSVVLPYTDVSDGTGVLAGMQRLAKSGNAIEVETFDIGDGKSVAARELMSAAFELEFHEPTLFVFTSRAAAKNLPFSAEFLEETAAERRLVSEPVARTGVRSSPNIMAATLAGLFLAGLVVFTFSCLLSIDSSPKMMSSPPSTIDPQYSNTSLEGKRFYPYKNLPATEY